MMIEKIYVITDEQLMPGRTHADIAAAALEGGASVIQLRDKKASDRYLMQAGLEIRRLTSKAGVPFIVNDRIEVAIACKADGLHVGQEDDSAREVRPRLPGRILGVSVTTPSDAVRACADGADYLGVGPVFATATKKGTSPPIGIEGLRRVIAVSDVPVVAIGGINESNVAEIAQAGAAAASVISAVVCAEDMTAATRRLVEIWDQASADLRDVRR